MQGVLLGDAGAGILHVDLADGVAGAVLQLPLVHQHGAEGDGKDHIVVLDELLGLSGFHQFPGPAEEHISLGGEEAAVHRGGVVAVELALVGGDAQIAEVVEVTVDGDDGVGGGGHLRGVELHRGTVGILRQLAAELGTVGQLHLRTGAAALLNVFLPLDDQDGFVVIITHGFPGDKVRVRAPDHLLPLQQLPGLVDQGLDHRRIIGGAEAVGIGHRGNGGAFLDGVDLADIGQVAQGVTGGVVHINIQIFRQTEPGIAGHSGGCSRVRVDVQHHPKQGDACDAKENQPGKGHQHLIEDILLRRRRSLIVLPVLRIRLGGKHRGRCFTGLGRLPNGFVLPRLCRGFLRRRGGRSRGRRVRRFWSGSRGPFRLCRLLVQGGKFPQKFFQIVFSVHE